VARASRSEPTDSDYCDSLPMGLNNTDYTGWLTGISWAITKIIAIITMSQLSAVSVLSA